MRKLILVWVVAIFATSGWAQETLPRNDVKDQREGAYAFTNAIIVADYQTVFNNGLMLIRDGKIEYVGNSKATPAGYTTINLTGKRIYPTLIDAYSNYGQPKVERVQEVRPRFVECLHAITVDEMATTSTQKKYVLLE